MNVLSQEFEGRDYSLSDMFCVESEILTKIYFGIRYNSFR